MQTSDFQSFEDYLRRKELELSLINSKIAQEYPETSTSYSDSPLINFIKRVDEFEVKNIEKSTIKRKLRAHKKVIYIFLILILALVSVLLIL